MTRRPGEAATAFTNKGSGGTFTANGTLVAYNRPLQLPQSPFKLQPHFSSAVFTYVGLDYSPSLSLFAAVSGSALETSNFLMTSSDGVTWTERNLLSRSWAGVHWVEDLGLFIALRSGTTEGAATSSNGIDWTFRTTPAGAWEELAWSSSLTLAVATGFGVGQIMTSPDGINWTIRTSADAAALHTGVAWSPSLGLFCACTANGTGNGGLERVMTSTDGTSWTIRTASVVGAWEHIAWSASLGLFACVSNDGKIMTSPDGINWTTRAIQGQLGTPDYRCITAVGSPMGGFVVSGEANPDDNCGIMYMVRSVDGVTWKAWAAASAGRFRRIVDANGQRKIVSVGSGNGGAPTSTGWASSRQPVQMMTY
jgi:hypothetical protein